MVNFQLTADETISTLFRSLGINDFDTACDYIARIPYGRNSNRADFLLVVSEKKGTCSSKHALLTALAEENAIHDIELIAGIFMLSRETHPQLASFFHDKLYDTIPECHCYLRFKGQRFDFTDRSNGMERIAAKIVREQRIEPHQVRDWKIVIHKHYMEGWLKRNPNLTISLDELWADREELINQLSTSR